MKRITVMVEDERAVALITLLLPQAHSFVVEDLAQQAQPAVRLEQPPPLTKARKASVRRGSKRQAPRSKAGAISKHILQMYADGRWFHAFQLGELARTHGSDPKRYHNSLNNLKQTGRIETDQRERPYRYRVKQEAAVEPTVSAEHRAEQ